MAKQLPTWLGRQLAHPDHAHDLERAAAMLEFGPDALPRSQAEERAYQDYAGSQRTQAAAHHLASMRAASAAGDQEAARKHAAMYAAHARQMGHEVVGPAHESVLAAMRQHPVQVKFRPHPGDIFVASKGDVAQPEHQKSEQHATDLFKGDVVGQIGDPRGAEPQPKRKAKGFHDIGIAGARKWARESGVPTHPDAPKYGEYFGKPKKTEKAETTPASMAATGSALDAAVEKRKQLVDRAKQMAQKTRELSQVKRGGAWTKSEMDAKKISKEKKAPCRCDGWKFPHRHGSSRVCPKR